MTEHIYKKQKYYCLNQRGSQQDCICVVEDLGLLWGRQNLLVRSFAFLTFRLFRIVKRNGSKHLQMLEIFLFLIICSAHLGG